MSIVKTDVPLTSQLNDETIAALVARYPGARSGILTTTAYGRPVRTLTYGNGGRQVIFTAAHHANEWITTPLLLKFMEELMEAAERGGTIFGVPARNIRDLVTIHTVPMVNPDGVDLVTGAIREGSREWEEARVLGNNYPTIAFPSGWKANLNGVDLNLQYPAGWLRARDVKFSQGYTRPGPRDYVGRWPLSQKETAALAAWTEDIDPRIVVALHTQGEVIYWQFEDRAPAGARELGEEFARLSGYRLSDVPYSSSFAGFKDWFIRFFNRPGYTIEVGLGKNPLPISQFDEIYPRLLGILVTAATGLPGGA